MASSVSSTKTLMFEVLQKRWQENGLGDILMGKTDDLLKNFLKILVSDKHNFAMKLQVLVMIEEEWEIICHNSEAVILAVTTLRTLVKQPAMNDVNTCILQGQCLMTATTLLLTTLPKDDKKELTRCIVSHLEYLMSLLSQTNNSHNVYLRSVAANCLKEIELNFKGTLFKCLDAIYTLAAFETTIAHQQYLELFSVLMTNFQSCGFDLSTIVPMFQMTASMSARLGITSTMSSGVTPEELEQIVTFALSQLPYLSTAASVRVATHMANLLMVINNRISLGSHHLLQPVLQQYLYSHNLTAFQLIMRLDQEFRFLTHAKDAPYHQSILDHLSNCSTLPALPASSRLIFLAWLKRFLIRHPGLAPSLSGKHLLYPQLVDGSHTRLKKVELLPYLPDTAIGSSSTHLLEYIDAAVDEVKTKRSIKMRSAFIKILYQLCNSYRDRVDIKTHITSCLTDVSKQDVSFAPFLLNFLQVTNDVHMKLEILGNLMPELTKSCNVSDDSLLCTLEIMMLAVETQNISISQPQEILSYIINCLENPALKVNGTLGHHILSLCHKIMKLFDVREFMKEMEAVLTVLPTKCTEEDVQNRAQSYTTLLTCLSDQKVKEVLKAQKKNLSHLMVTEGMFHKSDSLQVLDVPFFKMQKQPKPEAIRPKADTCDLLNISYEGTALEVYMDYMKTKASLRAVSIPVVITLEDHVKPDDVPIQAAVIFLAPSFLSGKLESLMIGNLTQKLMLSPNREVTATIKYFPEQPYPTKITARSEFTMNGLYYCCPLETLSIEFADLLQPLPVPEEFENSTRQWRKEIFSQLWEKMKQDEGTNYCTSSTVVNRPMSLIHYQLKHDLKPYIVNKGAHEADIGIFLAPASHVILKATLTESSTIFFIATDDIYLLAHVNDYLSHW